MHDIAWSTTGEQFYDIPKDVQRQWNVKFTAYSVSDNVVVDIKFFSSCEMVSLAVVDLHLILSQISYACCLDRSRSSLVDRWNQSCVLRTRETSQHEWVKIRDHNENFFFLYFYIECTQLELPAAVLCDVAHWRKERTVKCNCQSIQFSLSQQLILVIWIIFHRVHFIFFRTHFLHCCDYYRMKWEEKLAKCEVRLWMEGECALLQMSKLFLHDFER